MRIITATILALGLITGTAARAAEFVLRAQCEARGQVVTLGDVAEIVTADAAEAERLGAIELFPTPPSGRQHFAQQREIQDLLLLRGVNLSRHRFSGSSQVAIGRPDPVAKKSGQEKLTVAMQRRVKRQLCEAIADYLRRAADDSQHWTVELELDDAQSRLMVDLDGQVAISGGQSPWTGKQRFQVVVTRPNQPAAQFPIDAQVTLPPAVIIATRPLPRGVILCAADVELKRDAAASTQTQVFQSIDEVVGRETTRAMGQGMAIEQDAVRSPILIRRGEVVTVTAVAGGVRVSTNARAKADAGLGELVPLESLHDRTTYFARVAGLREAEVYAGAVKARSTDATPPARKERTKR